MKLNIPRKHILRIGLYVVLLVSAICSLQACKKDKESTPQSELVGVWEMYDGYDYDITNDEKQEWTRYKYGAEDLGYFEFKENGTLYSYALNGRQLGSGTYEYEKDSRRLLIIEDGETVITEVVKLDQSDLHLNASIVDDEGDGTFAELYFRKSSLPRRR